MPEDFQRRLPSKQREIAEIKTGDIRISLIGTILDKDKEGMNLILDDGTGKIDVNFESEIKFEVNQLVRVFGRVIPIENGFELQGEIIQDMSKLDMGLLKKVKGLKN